jgi:RNA recognition motif-containing protein
MGPDGDDLRRTPGAGRRAAILTPGAGSKTGASEASPQARLRSILQKGDLARMNIYVGNLPFGTTNADLEGLFAAHGTVDRAAVITDRDTGRSRGFGFVEMPNREEAETAIRELNGHSLDGRDLRVNEARPRT